MDDCAGLRAAPASAAERIYVLPDERFTWFGDSYWLNERSLTARERRLRDGADELGAMATPASLAGQRLRFPATHPRQGALYLIHPAQRGAALGVGLGVHLGVQPVNYFPLDSFHLRAFESKALDAIELLVGLGARQITAYAVQGYGPEVWLSSADPGIVRATADELPCHAAVVAFAREYPRPASRTVPAGLLWSTVDAQLKRIVQQRQSSAAPTLQCFISYPEDLGIDAPLAARLEPLGFEPVELFHEHQRTIWQLDATFWPTEGT